MSTCIVAYMTRNRQPLAFAGSTQSAGAVMGMVPPAVLPPAQMQILAARVQLALQGLPSQQGMGIYPSVSFLAFWPAWRVSGTDAPCQCISSVSPRLEGFLQGFFFSCACCMLGTRIGSQGRVVGTALPSAPTYTSEVPGVHAINMHTALLRCRACITMVLWDMLW